MSSWSWLGLGYQWIGAICRGWQNMCKNLTKIVDGFLSFLSWFQRMKLLMELSWIQSLFQMLWQHLNTIFGQNLLVCVWQDWQGWCWYVSGKRRVYFGRETLCREGVTIEVSPIMDGRVILTRKSHREKTIWWRRL